MVFMKLSTRNIMRLAAFSCALSSAHTLPAGAQVVVPTSISGSVPAFSNATSGFVLNNSITCPTPTFNITGFGGDADGSARTRTDIRGQTNADVSNWGAAIGLSIPIASKPLREFCKRYANATADFQETRTRNQEKNSKIVLLQQCLFIQDSLGIPISKNPAIFRDEGPLSPFAECLELSSVLDIANRKPKVSLTLPPLAPTQSATPEATPVTITQ